MTNIDLEALKAEIKAELLKELQKQPHVRIEKPWDEVKAIIIPRITGEDSYTQYHLLTAISTIIRYALDIRHLKYLTSDNVGAAKAIATQILDIIEKTKVKDTPSRSQQAS